MKTLTIFALLLCYLSSINAQAEFERGYLVTKDGTKTACLIKQFDWRYNPTSIEYKLNENTPVSNAMAVDIQLFAFDKSNQYVSYTVEVDTTTDLFKDSTSDPSAQTTTKTLFLKIIFQGEADLYVYETYDYTRFFFKKKDGKITPLIYRKHVTADNKIREKITYKNQLAKNFACEDVDYVAISKLKYTRNSISNFLKKYHKCNNYSYKIPNELSNTGKFLLSIRPTIRSSNVHVSNPFLSTKLERKFSPSVGLETEYLFAFKRNKYALIAEPTFNYHKSNSEGGPTSIQAEIDYKSVELPIGVRGYFHLNNKNAVFVNMILAFDFSIASKATFFSSPLEAPEDLNIKTGYSPGIGFGYRYNHCVSSEIRYILPRNVVKDSPFWTARYQTFAFSVGYQIL